MSDEKREGTRVPILGELPGEVMVFEPMAVKELGVSGVQVETHVRLHLNSLHDLRMALGERSVVIKARVIHSSISDVDQDLVTYRTGFEFVEPPEQIVKVIGDYLDTLRAERRPA